MPLIKKTGDGSGLPPKRGTVTDLMSVIGVALLLIAVYMGGSFLAHAHGVSNLWVLAGGMGFAFALGLGWTVRSLFKRRLFLPYFAAWIVAQTWAIVLAIRDYGTVAALPLILIATFLGYTLTFWLFGVPPELRAKGKGTGSDASKDKSK